MSNFFEQELWYLFGDEQVIDTPYEQALNIISEYVETELTPPPIHQKSNKKKARDAHER